MNPGVEKGPSVFKQAKLDEGGEEGGNDDEEDENCPRGNDGSDDWITNELIVAEESSVPHGNPISVLKYSHFRVGKGSFRPCFVKLSGNIPGA